jgi:hypothetical protein
MEPLLAGNAQHTHNVRTTYATLQYTQHCNIHKITTYTKLQHTQNYNIHKENKTIRKQAVLANEKIR